MEGKGEQSMEIRPRETELNDEKRRENSKGVRRRIARCCSSAIDGDICL